MTRSIVLRVFLPILGMFGIQISSAQDVTLTVTDPRPVAKVVEALVSRYGYVITYEDPPYGYGDDLEDVTSKVRKDLDKFPPGNAPKVMIPRGGELTLNASITSPPDMGSALDLLVAKSRSRGGHFRVQQSSNAFHVVPTEVRDANGTWRSTKSVLDTLISLPPQDRPESVLIDAICNAVSLAAHVKVMRGSGVGVGIGSVGPTTLRSFGADNEVARDVLMRALAVTNTAKRTWVLLYDASKQAYFLSILNVPDRSPGSQTATPSGGLQMTARGGLRPCTMTDTDPRLCDSSAR